MPQILVGFTVLGWTLELALNDPAASQPRTLDVVELFCGVGNVYRQAIARGMRAKGMDKHSVPGDAGSLSSVSHFSTRQGFKQALGTVLAIREGGLLVQAPPCASMGYLNCRQTKRSNANVDGDETYQPVRDGNLMSAAAAFFLALASLRGIFAVTENPTGSYLFKLRCWTDLASNWPLTFTDAARCSFSSERWGTRALKVYTLAGLPWASSLACKCHCDGQGH